LDGVRALWVARLDVSRATAQKITLRHGLEVQEVRDAVECVAGLVYTWHEDEQRGLRAIVQIHVRGKRALVVLYQSDDPLGDVYNLGSAYSVGS
jgi:hypothetical protein